MAKNPERRWSGKRGEGEAIKFVRQSLASNTDECIFWPFFTNPINGYCHFGFEGKQYAAHRYICEQVHGPKPMPKHLAAHSCHKRDCINWRHINWKTPSENMLDKRENGTAQVSWWGKKGKLKIDDVRSIRALEGKFTQDALARMFNVTESNIRFILTRKTWKKVA